MTVLLPYAVVALVVIAILDAPVFTRDSSETRLVLCRDTGNEVANGGELIVIVPGDLAPDAHPHRVSP